MMENTNPIQPGSPNDVAANADAVETDVDQLSQKLSEYEDKLGEMRDVLLRERAEIENQRKRLQRDLEQARKFANERLLGDLLANRLRLQIRGIVAGMRIAAPIG